MTVEQIAQTQDRGNVEITPEAYMMYETENSLQEFKNLMGSNHQKN